MNGLRGWMIVVLGVCVIASAGCNDKMVAKKDYDALKEHNDRLMKQNEALRGEVQDIAAARTEKATDRVEPASFTEATRPKTPDLETIRRSLPAGATLVMRNGQPVIRISGALVNYGSGKAGVNAEGKQALDRVAVMLNSDFAGRMVQIEGHTDNDPINKTKHLYQNNWELGMKRATGVVDYLITRGVDPKRIRAVSFGEQRPISSNKSENRRVEIVVLPEADTYGFPPDSTGLR